MASILDTARSYSYDALLTIIMPFYNQAMTERAAMRTNTSRISALAAQIRAISDPSARAAAQAALEPTSRAQAQIKIDSDGWVNRWNAAMNNLNNWAASAGVSITGPPLLLSGLGVAPAIVPAAIVLAFAAILVGGFLIYLHERNAGVANALAPLESAAARVNTGAMTPSDFKAFATSYTAATKAAAGAAGTGGLQDIIGSLALPLALVAAILIVPKMLPRRAAA